ncbi:helix-turn-helix domain-containing protein [Bradyrhizobium sp. USDA 4454]
MLVRRVLPHPALRGVIRSFGERRGSLGSRILTWPLAARPHQIIDIQMKEPLRLRIDGGSLQTSPETVVVGPQGSRRTQIHVSGDIHLFNILLQPSALHRLTGIDMTLLVNEGIAAHDVLGSDATKLDDAVRLAPDFSARVAVAERWFGEMLERSDPEDAIDRASKLLLGTGGAMRIDAVVRQSELSARQFQRRFTTQIGLPPKLYARTIRFDNALMAHQRERNRPWTQIIHEAGYFDQAHFIRECHALVDAAPGEFIDDWDNIFPLDVRNVQS